MHPWLIHFSRCFGASGRKKGKRISRFSRTNACSRLPEVPHFRNNKRKTVKILEGKPRRDVNVGREGRRPRLNLNAVCFNKAAATQRVEFALSDYVCLHSSMGLSS